VIVIENGVGEVPFTQHTTVTEPAEVVQVDCDGAPVHDKLTAPVNP